jgi:ATP-dependent Clp protease ATP-binding subunit ClpC
MPKVNIYLPDDLAEAVREAGVPVSAVCQRALEGAVRRVTAIREAAAGGSNAGMQHLTQRARTTLQLALRRARAAGAPEVGSEHLLAGMLDEGGNLALPVLSVLDIEPDQVRRGLALPEPSSDDSSEGSGPPLGQTAVNALEMAVTEATAFGHNYIGCEHLLLGLITEPDGEGGRVLRGLGAEPRLTRRAVAGALAGYVHLRAQTAAQGNAPAEALAQALQPIIERLDRLEARVGIPD